MKNTVKIEKKNTKMIAHRGVSALERENTNAAFVAAGNRSYFGIETDIHKTADGNFIIIHDDTTTRVAGVEYKVEHTDFATLRAITLFDIDKSKGRADLCMPALEEYIGICKGYGKVAVLELKNQFEENEIHKICDRIIAQGYMDSVIFISFYYDNLVYLKRKYPDAQAQYLCSSYDCSLIDKLKRWELDLDIKHTALTKEIVAQLHREGITVNCWTVDDPARAEELVGYGVDMITSNILE